MEDDVDDYVVCSMKWVLIAHEECMHAVVSGQILHVVSTIL